MKLCDSKNAAEFERHFLSADHFTTDNLHKNGRNCHIKILLDQPWEHLHAKDTSIASCFSVTGGFDNKSTQKL